MLIEQAWKLAPSQKKISEIHVLCMGFGELGEAVGSVGVGDGVVYWILDDEIVGDNDNGFQI